ncbi:MULTISPECIES: heavy metal translocating P-type ATPase [Mycobacterium]|nr:MULTISPECIES: heavy metal translocating P-type ATPase [Mycobacterium]MDO2374978.1 heavy metal translocating P-type ATPase [Mycobacterium avium subsp. hominissuis]MDO2384515.1 heavy metal translocating P-type ATPase [Mycobacterium avium subsp. hominissuis]MDO2388997.1 heavy metal translocating P-type ATPase [Mycobacterium avium subsp. hominissuis]MDO2396598.1 heavy metal translocating P-type ATPase [Mycobacterium avium subsp. hominissuis]WSE49007.1 heavy metal translocating P-type ATPase [My
MTTDVRPDAGAKLTVVSDAAGRMRVHTSGFRFDAVRAAAIEDTVGKVTGVRAVYAYPRTASVVIWYSPGRCDSAAVLSAIADAQHIPAASVPAYAPHSADIRGVVHSVIDWTARTLSGRPAAVVAGQRPRVVSDACGCDHDDIECEPERLWQVSKLRRAALSGVLLGASVVTAWVTPVGPIALGLKVFALAVGASTFVPSSLRRLTEGRIGVGTLMTIAAAGAVALGQVGEAAMLAFLFSISEGLEEYAVARTRRGLRALLSLVPDQATVLREGIETVVAAADLRVGDQMIVKPGERLATDGIIRAGRTTLDVSAITGESVPVEAGPGDDVFAASINGSGVLQVQVTATAEDNSLARIVHIVEAEQARKGASQRLADRIARPLVPGIMIAGALIAATGIVVGSPLIWVERALVVLVAASPCALAIAVPVSVVAAIGAASKLGVLIKGGAALEALGTIGGIALDKTGTLTANRPAVIDIATTNGATREEVLAVAAALEARSEHPLAAAVLAAAPAPTAAGDVQAVPGAGLTGQLDGHAVRLGRPGWLEPADLADDVARMQQAGATVVLVERDTLLLGAIAVRDELRPEAGEVIAALRAARYEVAMLTGDNHATAAALAAQAGIKHVHAELRPEDKAQQVRQLRARRPIAMVGDGVNDAPALAAADVGIAMGAMGTDVAIETADVALMGQDLRHLPQALQHARRSRRIMRQNVGLSLGIITVLMPLALFGFLGLTAVVLVHELTEVIVVVNGVRAGRTKPLTAQGKTPESITTHGETRIVATGRSARQPT